MLPCWRRTFTQNQLVPKPFSNISKNIMNMMLNKNQKWSTDTLKKHPTIDAKQHRNKLSQIRQTFRLWLPFGSKLSVPFLWWRVLLTACFPEPLGGTPLDRCWPPLRHPWSDFLDVLKELEAKLLQKSKIPEQQMAPDTPSKNNRQGSKQTLPIINPNK